MNRPEPHAPPSRETITSLRITVLSDNFVIATNALGEHGLSLFIEADDRRILFDTGQSRVALDNAEALGIDLTHLDAVVLSHGHFDHTGGLADLLPECSPAAILLHPAAVEPKYDGLGAPPHRAIGMPAAALQSLDALRDRIVWTRSATEIVPGLWCTGEIPRLPGNAQSIGDFFLDPECRTPDPLCDDQALYVNTPDGLVVIAGCTHSGLANTLDRACTLHGCESVHALLGGFHLMGAARPRLEAGAAAIAGRACRILAPCHCTGLQAHAHLRTVFPGEVRDVGVGTRLVLAGPAAA